MDIHAKDKTKIVCAMSLLRVLIDDSRIALDHDAKNRPILNQLDKIERWMDECLDDLNPSYSRGAERDVNMFSQKVYDKRVEIIGTNKVNEKTMTQELIAVDGLINWIKTRFSLKTRPWRYLEQTVETLTKGFVQAFPEHEDCEFYLAADEVLNIR